ncbi:hypothetical protein FPV67DRAFT_1446714 [Lyophyllum atratum]|nr:hypothetical protein FPV67DRAFT_1446714 [Lyophyllum atratum]
MSHINVAGLVQSGWVRNAHVACAALVIYEHLLQLGNEVELFWKRRWTLGKVLFLWSYAEPRFTPYFIQSETVKMPISPSQTIKQGTRFFFWQNGGAAIQVLITHIILQMRLYAMYGNTRKILVFFVALTSSEVTILGVIGAVGSTDPERRITNEPFPDVFICAHGGDPQNGQRLVACFYTIVILVEGIMLALALKKAWMYRPSIGGSRLMQQLMRDSAIYFSIIFSIYLANLAIWVHNRITLNELGIPFSFAFSSIFANRLLIGVRVAYYGSSCEPEDDCATVPIRFTPTVSAGNQYTQERIELRTFNERIGA